MDLVLNELSIIQATDAELEERLVKLVATLKRLFEHGAARVVRTLRDVLDRTVVGEQTLRQWLFSRGPRLEEKRFLARLMDKPPYADELLADAESKQGALLEFHLDADRAPGLGVAYVLDAPAVSFDSAERFKTTHLSLRFLSVAEKDAEEVVRVVHARSPACVDSHRPWLEERMQRDVASGSDLWSRRAALFPRLDFCACVEKQVMALSGAEAFFAEIVRHLHVLSRTAADWKEGSSFDPPLKWSPESKATLDSRELAAMRTFLCPDGLERVFSFHTKIFAWNKRIHFFPVPATRIALVGHVGEHLATQLY